ncbi:unnamed protein product [Mytilus edulis]|uniref:MACPF domain-containing protein n=1 Tax=Mytilus edulis TaxID=6550 RepID=A0A8S3PYW5_MYTED|nr:unnamed protein product [Mytilus edulis]
MSWSSNKLSLVEQKKENETPLAKKIKGEGLDASTWEKHFREMGIHNEEAVQHIDRTTLYKLLKKTSHPWKRLHFKKLFNEGNISELTKQENYLKELRQQLRDPRNCLSETLKQDDEGRKMKFDEKSYMRDMEKVIGVTQKEPSEDQIVTRRPLKSYDLIRQIAAGQLLRGQFIHENLQKSSTYRKQLIQVDEPIELMSPGISETMEILEFDDKKQSDEFDSVLNQYGVNFALEFCGRISLIAQADGKDALKCLHDKFISEDSSFEKHCNSFFNEFGSHYYTGIWHFGGRYKWAVTSITDSPKDRRENYQKAKIALSGSVSGGFRWFGGEVKGAYEDDTGQVTETRTFSEKFKVTKKLEKFGGPQEVDNISLWKKGLAEHNKTWVIIDKDVSQKCYKGVWTLIHDQECSFSNSIEDAWGKHLQENAG